MISVLFEIVEFYKKFDLIYISKGVLVWFPEIKQLIKSASKLLHKGGKLFLYDQHPFTHLFDSDQDGDLVVKFDYFKQSLMRTSIVLMDLILRILWIKGIS